MTTYNEFKEYELYMLSAVHSVIKQVGGDINEMKSDLYLLYAKAKKNYNSDRGRPFKSYLYKVVWDDLYSMRRVQIDRNRRHPITAIPVELTDRRRFDFASFLSELSNEAKLAIEFAMNPPPTVKLCHDGTPKQKSLLAQLQIHFQWSKDQFNSVCEEIRAAL